ncbi:MAG TPA: hypothetical protein ENK66_05080 [Arcobacter sp.]|nr:hypothetical protein [Arcobacter sp.]
MTGIEVLNNHGIEYIGEQKALNEEKKTLIVLGVARGGTSLLAGTLDHLGIFTGKLSGDPIFEDLYLANAFEKKKIDEAKKIIQQYNKHDIWSFKRPGLIDYITELDSLCRNPIYLIVFKDIFSISNRNSISMKLNIVDGLKKAQEGYGKILSFIEKNNPNAFLLSYEKIMENKEHFIDILVNLIGKEKSTEESRLCALNFIEPNPKNYLDVSRITRSIGQIGLIKKHIVQGWGKYKYRDDSAIVELYVNDKLIASKTANEARKHMENLQGFKHVNYGYSFQLLENGLKEGDVVSVKLKDDVLFLKGSHTVFKEDAES